MSRVCQKDGSFGPAIGQCRGGFDFTLSFEQSIMGLLPQAAFLLLAPLRLATLRRRRNRIAKPSPLGLFKLGATCCYAISSIILCAMWGEIKAYKTNLSIASAAVEFIASLVLVILSRLEHTRAIRPSHLLQFFLLLLLLCNAVRLRTLCLMGYPTSLVTLASLHTFLTGVLLFLESLDKAALFISRSQLPPEETVGLFARRLLWYLNDLFKEGYHKILKPSDLFRLDADLAAKERTLCFQDAWERQDQERPTALSRTIAAVLWLDLLFPVLPRTILIATNLSQPYLITAMIRFIQDRDDPDTLNVGYGLIAAFALNYTVLAISSCWYRQSAARFSTKLRSCLISLIYERTLHAKPKDVNLGSATVLMNVDVEKVLKASEHIHESWASFVSTAVALYILYAHLGVAFVAPFVATLLCTAICTWLGKLTKVRQLHWVAATEQRVTSIAYMVGLMKGIRMLGLTETVLEMLTQLRIAEVAAHRYVRNLLVWILTVSNMMFQVTTLAMYTTFTVIALTGSNGPFLDLNVLYGSLSALKLVTSPMLLFLQLIPQIQAGFASLDRIQKFSLGKFDNPDSTGDQVILADGIELSHVTSPGPRPASASVVITDATFGVDEKPLLRNIDLQIQPGTFTIIIGKVGSGKSVLLRSIIGETELLSGSFERRLACGIAFADQTVWLRNATIRENIVEEATFDESWYNAVLWSCGLFHDLGEMKKGDLTSIGSKGISLSGGQKNRISLARALYARKTVLALDDMLAGLDSTTEKLVFDRVFGPKGLLRKTMATVVLVTHATHFARQADQVIVMSDGTIVQNGAYQDLIASKWYLGQFTKDEDRLEVSPPQGLETSSTPPNIALPLPEQSVEDEDTLDDARKSGDRRSLWFFLKAVGTLHCSVYFGLLILTTIATTIQLLWLKWWAQSIDPTRSSTVKNLTFFVVISVINIILFLIWIAHCSSFFMPRSSLALHGSQLTALMRAKFSNIVSIDTGSITNRFSQDISLVDNQLQYAWINVTSEYLLLISQFVLIVLATPPVAATIPLLAAVGYVIQRVYLRTSRQVRIMDLEAKAPLCTHFLETLAGVVTIRSFGWSSTYREMNNTHLYQSQVPFYLLFIIQNWLNLVLELVVAGLITVIVGLAVGLRSRVDPGFLGLALVAAMDLGFNFRMIILAWTELEISLSAVTRIRQFVQTPCETEVSTNTRLSGSWPERGTVQFKHFAASYSDTGKRVLTNVELDIEHGEKIGICGRTGSGKSSLVATLFGLLHQQAGEILVDHVATDQIPLATLRSKIIALPQDPVFLRGTVRYNLTPWLSEAGRPTVTDSSMKEALQQVQLWEKLDAARDGNGSALDISLDHVDSLLSQGEKQLFCLARATLMRGKIVVLDEATSSVDAQTDALMQRILRSVFADRTIIAIAHRLDTILDFDRVVVMDAGRIVEVGEPKRLLQTENSLFRALVEVQGKG